MKVCLISTNIDTTCIGLRTISSVLKKNGHETKLLMLTTTHDLFKNNIIRDVKKEVYGSDLIGISCVSNSLHKTTQLLKELKKTKIPIFWGGIHATIKPEECLEHSDFVCVGEGEGACLELVSRIEAGDNTYDIRNIWTKRNGKIIKNPLRPLINDLDALPFQDYDIKNHMVIEKGKLVPFKESRLGCCGFNTLYYKSNEQDYFIYTIRGCGQACTYCSNSYIKSLYSKDHIFVRKRGIENIIEELIEAKKRFPKIEKVFFCDDDFFLRTPSEIKSFSKKYKKMINAPFICYGYPKNITNEKISWLVDAGLSILKIGVQTGSESLNKNLFNRDTPNNEIFYIDKVMNSFKKREVFPEYQFITTNPYEKKKDIIKTIDFIKKLTPPYYMQISNIVFFPGSKLYEKAKNDCLVSKEDYLIPYIDYNSSIKAKKIQNRYLCSLLNLMAGKSTRKRVGFIPRIFLGPLSWKTTVFFNEKTGIMTKIFDVINQLKHNKFYKNSMDKRPFPFFRTN